MEALKSIAKELEQILDNLLEHQRERTKKYANTIRPDLTTEDLLNPDNFPQIISDPNFMYEDGQVAGILSARLAVLRLLKEKISDSGS